MSIDPARKSAAEADVNWLLAAARRHPLGVDFLLNGHLGSVAITFGCHAFTVVAARDFLNAGPARDASSRSRTNAGPAPGTKPRIEQR